MTNYLFSCRTAIIKNPVNNKEKNLIMWIEKSEKWEEGENGERTQMGGKLPQAHKNVKRIMGFDIVLVNGIVSQCHTPLPFFPGFLVPAFAHSVLSSRTNHRF